MSDFENDVEVPRFFLCPISLEIMKDPVTLSTGITYDRENIQKWLFSQKNGVCPVTKQVVVDIELTPNHTLRRFIQSWCTLNASSGFERFPTPRIPISRTEILKLLRDSKSPQMQMKSLKRLKQIVLENQMNKRLMESVGAADYLATILINVTSSSPAGEVSDEALSILYHLKQSPTALKSLFRNTVDFVETLTSVMQRTASYESRANAVMLLKSMFEVAEAPMQVTSLNPRLLKHGGGLAVVSKKIFRVSTAGSERAVRILHSVAMFSGNIRVLAEMLQLGVVGKLLLVLQVDCGGKTREKAREILKMHGRVWKKSPCLPKDLISSYPS